MSFIEILDKKYPERIKHPTQTTDILPGIFYVYILTIGDRPVVVGHGRKNRAKVIFDSVEFTTSGHIKAFTVRLHSLFGEEGAIFGRHLIPCESKDEAKQIEAGIHREFGGNSLATPPRIRDQLFHDIAERSPAWMVLRMALASSFDGITDLKKWRREGILDDGTWSLVADRLKLKL
ncbi:MAG: hypothetical protein K9N47_07215 [Prosthecobacter sp.]|uniref:hypothetical protein n=1 Tax=Prosthecobacter sp. TaxID=1965333 RepID=UPI0025E7FC2D|nr:hypothetical protein [Prosthecobacter sp.]MCF7785894.1 hypothetical protein [Prosthecobacter sp.]